MKKYLFLIVAVAAALVVAGIWLWNKHSATAEKSDVRTFTVGFDANFPPYGYLEGEEYKGFDLDLAREVCRRRGWKLVLKPINWDAKDSELNSGMIDCIWNGFTINGRENSYTWSDPYVINEQVVLVKKNSPVKKLSDLKGCRVAVQNDTPVQKALQKGGECQELGSTFKALIVTDNYENAVMSLESGDVDAVALDVGVAQVKMKSGSFRILDEIVMKEMYGIGFRKGEGVIRRQIIQWAILTERWIIEGILDFVTQIFGGGDIISGVYVKAEFISPLDLAHLPAFNHRCSNICQIHRHLGGDRRKSCGIKCFQLPGVGSTGR